MNIVFYVLLTMAAVYSIFNYKDFGKWYWNIIMIIPKKIWSLIKGIFKKE